ncbi:hypothetical protein K504DRAFT_217214 [Pleomassaria siparia CBS 279.74]|uniref:Uncharacterized protein n=1 Tax=Pleomassaria siparia CBS 279.74 TaxID=1314801 RepID=A0A6G1KEK7_9PLEO|nr:hypothetical protein K504DRAFT_217214 [Pleomassaria siparia CBS 279.74]
MDGWQEERGIYGDKNLPRTFFMGVCVCVCVCVCLCGAVPCRLVFTMNTPPSLALFKNPPSMVNDKEIQKKGAMVHMHGWMGYRDWKCVIMVSLVMLISRCAGYLVC